MDYSVYCIASDEPQANGILTDLRNRNFPSSSISVVLPNRTDTKNIAVEGDAIRGAEAGGLAGEIVGWLAGLSVLAIPGLGPLMIAGPLIAAFGGAVAGGAVGGLIGGTGAAHPVGLPADVTSFIEKHIRQGGILISVGSDDSLTRERAAEVFKTAGARDIYYHDNRSAA